jgi:hypothetical protein
LQAERNEHAAEADRVQHRKDLRHRTGTPLRDLLLRICGRAWRSSATRVCSALHGKRLFLRTAE